jgi:hypothetical protein
VEDHVPQSHLLRSIDRFVDLSNIRQYLSDFYSHTGHPSIDPELLIRMLLVGYCFGIRSERRLCEEVHLSLAQSLVLPPRSFQSCALCIVDGKGTVLLERELACDVSDIAECLAAFPIRLNGSAFKRAL